MFGKIVLRWYRGGIVLLNKIINKGDVFMNDLMVFNNVEFGEIRSVQIDGKIYFVGKDIASALGYKYPSSAVSKHCKHIKKVQ